jgi:hypothetical protein
LLTGGFFPRWEDPNINWIEVLMDDVVIACCLEWLLPSLIDVLVDVLIDVFID